MFQEIMCNRVEHDLTVWTVIFTLMVNVAMVEQRCVSLMMDVKHMNLVMREMTK